MGLTNWAGNVEFSAGELVRCASVAEVQEAVASAERVRVLGSGHSFNRIADTTGTLISVAGLPPVVEVDTAARQVNVSAGLRYGEVTERLHAAGLALHNLGSLPHISIAGACATGTHGSGDTNGTLASAVAAIDLVRADGSLIRVRRGEPDFPGSVLALGALGVVVGLTLDAVPAFDVRQFVYDDLPLDRLGSDLDAIWSSAYSVSAFTDWQRPVAQIWRKALADQEPLEPGWLGSTPADGPRHPVPGMPATYSTEQLGVPGPWFERIPHFQLRFTPSTGEELQSEYFVPREVAPAAFEAIAALGPRMAGLLQISEIRTIAAEDLWLSPSQGRDTVALHFTWVREPEAVQQVVEAIEQVLAPFGARPHWGKVFAMESPRELYDHAKDFAELLERSDPAGKFRNDFLDRYWPRG
ncbi:FAD-binding protein [Kribbella deserti]|uniref:FAD-binding protein n=1 Tax=Kribbella deserti TaxID=1926257 RepID=A0ABV6QPP7_9ACTN